MTIIISVETRDDCDCGHCDDDTTYCWTVSSHDGEAFSDAVGGDIGGSSVEVDEDDFGYVILIGVDAESLASELAGIDDVDVHWEGYFHGAYGGEGSDLDAVLRDVSKD